MLLPGVAVEGRPQKGAGVTAVNADSSYMTVREHCY